MSDVWENTKEHRYVYAAIEETWGPRCPDYEPGCPCCNAWAEYDGIRNKALEEAAKVCDAIENKLTEQWKAGYKVCDYTQGASDGANDCAAAIRAMKKKST